MSSVTDYLKSVVDTMPERDDWRYNTYEALVLDQGQSWSPPAESRLFGPIKECFSNAWHAAIEHGWTYVEGYADSIIPVAHAWCVDDDGVVVETTWETPGTEYYGVPLRVGWVADVASETGYWGVFGNDWKRECVLLKEGIPVEAITKVDA